MLTGVGEFEGVGSVRGKCQGKGKGLGWKEDRGGGQGGGKVEVGGLGLGWR